MTTPPASSSPVAIITGASSGLGLALATQLLSKGYRVSFADINPPPSSVPLSPDKAIFTRTDVSSWDSQCALFAATYKAWGRLDFLAANAGIDDRFDLYSDETVERIDENGEEVIKKPNNKTWEVDVEGVLWGIWLAKHYFLKKRDLKDGEVAGRIVVTSSAAGIYSLPEQPLYTAAKYAVSFFSPRLKTLDTEKPHS